MAADFKVGRRYRVVIHRPRYADVEYLGEVIGQDRTMVFLRTDGLAWRIGIAREIIASSQEEAK